MTRSFSCLRIGQPWQNGGGGESPRMAGNLALILIIQFLMERFFTGSHRRQPGQEGPGAGLGRPDPQAQEQPEDPEHRRPGGEQQHGAGDDQADQRDHDDGLGTDPVLDPPDRPGRPTAATMLAATPKMRHRRPRRCRRRVTASTAPKVNTAARPSRYSALATEEPDRVCDRCGNSFATSRTSTLYDAKKLDPLRAGPAGISGTASNTGIAKIANQTAENSATTRMFEPVLACHPEPADVGRDEDRRSRPAAARCRRSSPWTSRNRRSGRCSRAWRSGAASRCRRLRRTRMNTAPAASRTRPSHR